MPLEFSEVENNIVFVKASGTLVDEDYQQFVPRMEKLMQQFGKLRMVFTMEDFHGWDLHSAWDELKFELKHTKDLKRVAVVGDRKWEKWASRLSGIFTDAGVRFSTTIKRTN